MDPDQANLREALKRVAVALKETGLPFALAGGYAVWARGGPEPDHDVDFLVTEGDAARVAELLAERGLKVEHPPEDWLFKVWTDDVMVDVLFRAAGSPVQEPVLEASTEVEVLSVRMPVLAATDLMVQKLAVLTERYCDLTHVLPVARAMREQVDWDVVRKQTAENPFAEAVLFLLERLEVVPTG
jgi:Uncharacterised nucleotidyltransferase